MTAFRPLVLTAVAATGLFSAGAGAQGAGDPAKGRALLPRCTICHDMKPGVNRVGPSLAGVMNRKAGTLAGFAYSPAMKKAGIVWNRKALDGYLAKPSRFMPGNKMVFAGLPNPVERANLIAYLARGGK